MALSELWEAVEERRIKASGVAPPIQAECDAIVAMSSPSNQTATEFQLRVL